MPHKELNTEDYGSKDGCILRKSNHDDKAFRKSHYEFFSATLFHKDLQIPPDQQLRDIFTALWIADRYSGM